MPDFPYLRSRNWVNEEDGPISTDPVADDAWFEAVEAAIHQGQDHEKAVPEGGGSEGGASSVILVARLSANHSYSTSDYGLIPFDSALKDGSNILSSATTGHVVFPEAGLYRVSVALSASTSESGDYWAEVYFERADGSLFPRLDMRGRASVPGFAIGGSRVVSVAAANEEWYASFYSNPGVSHTLSSESCELVIERV